MTRVLRAACIYLVVGILALPFLAWFDTSAGAETNKPVEKTWGDAVEDQAVSITTEKAVYAPGERIVLNACLKNIGQHDVKAITMQPSPIYQVSVLLPDGKELPLTLYGNSIFKNPWKIGSRSTRILKPGEETHVEELQLSRLFDFSLAGKYVISVKRAVIRRDGTVRPKLYATSNKLEITVDESIEAKR